MEKIIKETQKVLSNMDDMNTEIVSNEEALKEQKHILENKKGDIQNLQIKISKNSKILKINAFSKKVIDDDIKEIRKTADDVYHSYRNFQKMVNDVNEDLDTVNDMLKANENYVKEYKENGKIRLQQLETILKEKQSIENEQISELEKLEKENELLTKEVESYKLNNSNLIRKNREKEEHLKNIENQIKDKLEERNKLISDGKQMKCKIEEEKMDIEEKIKEVKNRTKELNIEFDQEKEIVQTLEDTLKQNIVDELEFTQKLEESKNKFKFLQNNYENANNSLEKYKTKLEDELDNTVIKENKDKQKEAIEAIESIMNEELDQEIEHQQSIIRRLVEEISTLRQENELIREEIPKASNVLKALKENEKDLKDNLDLATEEINKNKKILEEREEMLKNEKENENCILLKCKEDFEKILEEINKKFLNIDTECQEIYEKNEKMKEEVNNLEAKLKESAVEKLEIMSAKSKSVYELQQFQTELNTIRAEIKRLEAYKFQTTKFIETLKPSEAIREERRAAIKRLLDTSDSSSASADNFEILRKKKAL